MKLKFSINRGGRVSMLNAAVFKGAVCCGSDRSAVRDRADLLANAIKNRAAREALTAQGLRQTIKVKLLDMSQHILTSLIDTIQHRSNWLTIRPDFGAHGRTETSIVTIAEQRGGCDA